MKPADILTKLNSLKSAEWFQGSRQRNIQLVLTVVIILLINLAASTCNMRLDLTRAGSYSLSEKSRSIVGNLKERMKIKVFFSENLPVQHAAVFRYLTDLLREYDYWGNRNFDWELVPEKNLEQEAADYGIQPVQSQEFENDQTTLRSAYMGLVIQHADLIEKINALTSSSGLEYEITSRMEKMNARVSGLLQLKEPIKVRLYYDSRLKALPISGLDSLAESVSEAVEAASAQNYGKLVFEAVDTAAGVDIDAVTADYGINRLKWRAGSSYPAGEGLLNIVMLNGGRFRLINLGLAPTLFGGYVITGLDGLEDALHEGAMFLLGTNTRIGYVTGHGTVDIQDNRTREGGAVFSELLSDSYELVNVDLSSGELPAGISVLIINGPKTAFSEEELFMLDQYLIAGNSLLLFLDSFEETGMQEGFMSGSGAEPVSTGLEDMLQSYGIAIGKNIVLDESCAKVSMRQSITDYPALPIILKSGFNKKSVVTKFLNSAAFFKASALEFDKDALKERRIDAEALVSSSDNSWLMTDNIDFNPMLMEMNKPKELAKYVLCAELSGRLESFFKDKDIKALSNERITSVERLDATPASADSSLIIAGTSQITRSGFILDSRQVLSGIGAEDEAYSNEILLHSMVDRLAGNSYIPEMKSKSLAYNPIDRISSRMRVALKFLNIAGAPIITVAAGLILWRRRMNKKRLLQKHFAANASNEKNGTSGFIGEDNEA